MRLSATVYVVELIGLEGPLLRKRTLRQASNGPLG